MPRTSEMGLLPLISFSLTNWSHACLQGHQVYLDRLEKSRNKISPKIENSIWPSVDGLVLFLSILTLSANSSNILRGWL